MANAICCVAGRVAQHDRRIHRSSSRRLVSTRQQRRQRCSFSFICRRRLLQETSSSRLCWISITLLAAHRRSTSGVVSRFLSTTTNRRSAATSNGRGNATAKITIVGLEKLVSIKRWVLMFRLLDVSEYWSQSLKTHQSKVGRATRDRRPFAFRLWAVEHSNWCRRRLLKIRFFWIFSNSCQFQLTFFDKMTCRLFTALIWIILQLFHHHHHLDYHHLCSPLQFQDRQDGWSRRRHWKMKNLKIAFRRKKLTWAAIRLHTRSQLCRKIEAPVRSTTLIRPSSTPIDPRCCQSLQIDA